MLSKIIQLIKFHQSDVVLAVCVIMLTIISFNLGKISAGKDSDSPVTITGGQEVGTANIYKPSSGGRATKSVLRTDPTVIASSKSKTKYYHFTWCSGAKQISEKNKLTFPNESSAMAAGYTLASNCDR